MSLHRLLILLVVVTTACRDSNVAKAPAPNTEAERAAVTPVTDASDPRLVRGAALHARYCALCHGRDARGYAADNAPSLVTPTFLASADDSFFSRSIELGRPGTAMAGYAKAIGGPLTEADIGDLVAFYRSHGPSLVAPVAPVGGVAGRGAARYQQACQRCHGDVATRGTAPHLANPTFLALASDGFLRYAIASGRPGTPMEAFASTLSAEQIADLVAFLRSLATPPTLPPPAPGPGPAPDGTPIVMHSEGRAPRFTLREDRFVSVAQVAEALAAKRRMVIVDARAPSDWARERIPGAVSIPYYEVTALDRIPNDGTWVVAYCACPHHASGIVVDELRKRGYRKTAVLDEGILVWRQKGFPIAGDGSTHAAPPPMPGHEGHNH